MTSVFRTKDPQLAILLRHELGPEAHIGTVFDGNGVVCFEFDQRSRCLVILNSFYGRDGCDDFVQSGYPVNDARALLQESAKVHKSRAKARSAWRKMNEGK